MRHCERKPYDGKSEATEIVAVDNDSATIRYARKEYHHQKIVYVEADVMDLDLELPPAARVLDTILNFETIEQVLCLFSLLIVPNMLY